MNQMPRTRVFSRSILNARPPNMTLNLECIEEPLSDAQLRIRTKQKENYDKVILPIIFFNDMSIYYTLILLLSGYSYVRRID